MCSATIDQGDPWNNSNEVREMIIRIHRSKDFMKKLNLSTGGNNPKSIEKDFHPAELPEAIREIVLAHSYSPLGSGTYPSTLTQLVGNHRGYQQGFRLRADVTEDDFTVEVAVSAIMLAALEMENDRLGFVLAGLQSQAKHERELAELEEKIDAFLADDSALDAPAGYSMSKRHHDVISAVSARNARQKEEAQAKLNAPFIRWVEERGTESQKERMAAGLLDFAEIKAEMERFAFDIVNLPRYADIDSDDVGVALGMHVEAIHTNEWVNAGPLQDDVWQSFKSARDTIQDELGEEIKKIDLIQHSAWPTTQDYPELRRWGIRVTINFNGATLTREFALQGVSDWIATSESSTPTNP